MLETTKSSVKEIFSGTSQAIIVDHGPIGKANNIKYEK
jgi:hypothetical protein